MLNALTDVVASAGSVWIGGGEGLDADAVGAAVALRGAILARWPEKRVGVAFAEDVPPGCAELCDGIGGLDGEVELAVVVDGGPERLGCLRSVYDGARVRAQIDHHRSATGELAEVALLDPSAASTTQMVAALCEAWGVGLDRRMAEAIYAGLVFDTGGFRYALPSPVTLRLAARCLEAGIDHARIVERVLLEQSVDTLRLRGLVAGRVQVDGGVAWSWIRHEERRGIALGGLVDDLVFLEGVEVGLLATGKARGQVKLSLRSRGGVDVSEVARALGPHGGGHARAAGVTVAGEPEAVARRAAVQTQAVSSR